MSEQNFVDAHRLRAAFIGNRLQRLVDLISEQGDQLLQQERLGFRAAACSTLLLLNEGTGMTIADVARRLSQPHQLVAQRTQALIKRGLLERVDDPDDARRKILSLTQTGRSQTQRLLRILDQSAQAFNQLQAELGLDIFALADQLQGALKQRPLSARIADRNGEIG